METLSDLESVILNNNNDKGILFTSLQTLLCGAIKL